MKHNLSFLPGQFRIAAGRAGDYTRLSRFHYLPKRPATWCQVWTIQYCEPGAPSRLVAVGVLSYPVPSSRGRQRALGLCGSRSQELTFANRHIRTISRLIVHPQFRALGLSSLLVRCLCEHCDTRYVEAMAVMGKAHPFFERAGMKPVTSQDDHSPIYYLFDRMNC